MRKRDFKGCRCEKRKMVKCEDVVRTFDRIQAAYAERLEHDSDVKSFQCNVVLVGVEDDSYTTDFIAKLSDGSLRVRECTWRKNITKPMTVRLLDMSRSYWLQRGVQDWGIVIEQETADGEK